MISRFRDNACLFYVYAGPRTGKRGRPKTKDCKIDMKNLDLTRTDTLLSGEEVLLYYRTRFQIDFCFQCFVHITKCCQGNYEGDGNGIFYVFIQVTDDQHLSGETNF